jgi:hypothetical protein
MHPVTGSLTTRERLRLLGRIVDAFERHGWRPDSQTAMAIVTSIEARGIVDAAAGLESHVPRRFLVQNEATVGEVRRALFEAVAAFPQLGHVTESEGQRIPPRKSTRRSP